GRDRAASRCTRRGPSTHLLLPTRWRRARWRRRTAPGPRARWARRRSRCTAASATRGSAWPTCTCGGRWCRAISSAVSAPTWNESSQATTSEVPMHFGDSPAEADFRARLRAWLSTNNPGLPASSTDDDYWRGQAAWHHALYDAGFFGLSWP